MKTLTQLAARLVREDNGQDLIEYALLAALIALACIVTMKLVAGGIDNLFTRVNNELTGAK